MQFRQAGICRRDGKTITAPQMRDGASIQNVLIIHGKQKTPIATKAVNGDSKRSLRSVIVMMTKIIRPIAATCMREPKVSAMLMTFDTGRNCDNEKASPDLSGADRDMTPARYRPVSQHGLLYFNEHGPQPAIIRTDGDAFF